MAMSADGFVARENGDEDFLSDYGWEVFLKLAKECGNFMIGRNTYEMVKKHYKDFGFEDVKGVKKIIVSQAKDINAPDFTVVSSPQEALALLEKEGFTKAYLAGGPGLNASFAKLGLIDEVIFNYEPVIIGQGLPVFAPLDLGLNLEYVSKEIYQNRVVQLRYKVKH